ncbi:MAG: xanthine dehydrogenase family protein subunit M [Fimbriimonadaceae bacterium]|nr:xanthine dehydrogenase family protein subunit M [Alphaproteobacteria bacterium]
MAKYYRPSTLREALDQRAKYPLKVLAGGTDVIPMHTTHSAWHGSTPPDIVDISAISELRQIDEEDDQWRLGALTTWSQLIDANLPGYFDGIKLIAKEIGGRQIQNRATIAGNLCNASPAADGVPGLLALESKVELTSSSNVRTMPLHEFLTGNRQTRLEADEIMTAILIPKLTGGARSHFLKLGARRYLVISIVMGAAVLVPDEHGDITDARISIGSCSAVARRIPLLEERLIGLPINGSLGHVVASDQFDHLEPIDDIRASAAYRRSVAVSLTTEMLDQLANRSVQRVS